MESREHKANECVSDVVFRLKSDETLITVDNLAVAMGVKSFALLSNRCFKHK